MEEVVEGKIREMRRMIMKQKGKERCSMKGLPIRKRRKVNEGVVESSSQSPQISEPVKRKPENFNEKTHEML